MERFPETATWVHRQLDQGPDGFDQVRKHLMGPVYFEALVAYFRGSSFRSLGEAREVIAEFYADRLSSDRFLLGWRASDKRLRHWMINGLKFFLQEYRRKQSRLRREIPCDDLEVAGDAPPEARMDREFALQTVNEAMRRMDEYCRSNDLKLNWKLLVDHECEGVPYEKLALEHGLKPVQARSRARTARGRFRAILYDLIQRDGVPDEDVDAEIQMLRESLRS